MQAAFEYIRTELHGIYPENEIRSISYLLIEKITGFSRTGVIVNKNTKISDEQRSKLEGFLEKLKLFMPVQYVLGETEFMDMKFVVNDSVLIPRPETEELVSWIQDECKRTLTQSILDIGTGSGCIAIRLKKSFPESNVTAFDISEKALQTAGQNAKMNDLEVSFRKFDILDPFDLKEQWDVIVSNPPYIPDSQKHVMEPNVLEFEPHLALFVPDHDPLLFYRKIAEFAQKYLIAGGRLYFEIHFDAGADCRKLLEYYGFEQVEVRMDLSGKDRMVRAIKPI